MAAFGRVDILVNNAGLSWGEAPETMPLDKWHKVIDANLTGAFLFSQAAGRDMLQARVRPHHQHRVGRRTAGVGQRSALCRLCREQGRADGPDPRTGGVVGTPAASASTPSRPDFSPRGWPKRSSPKAEAGMKANSPIPRGGAPAN